jgi:hypothetical protein
MIDFDQEEKTLSKANPFNRVPAGEVGRFLARRLRPGRIEELLELRCVHGHLLALVDRDGEVLLLLLALHSSPFSMAMRVLLFSLLRPV